MNNKQMKNIDKEVIKSIYKIDKISGNIQSGKLTNENLDKLRKSLANVIGYFEEKYIAIENILSNIGNGREKN
jgi:hypothetical protein